jgi:hypothetical protein
MKRSPFPTLVALKGSNQALAPSIGLNRQGTSPFESSSDPSEAIGSRTFLQRLEAAEDEARSFHETLEVAAKKKQSAENSSRSVCGQGDAIQSGRGQYNYDTQSADEEILSNVREVQRFNEELVTSEDEARSIGHGGLPLGGEPELLNLDSSQTLDLITSMVEVVREPLIILDNYLRVKKANRAFYRTLAIPRQKPKHDRSMN